MRLHLNVGFNNRAPYFCQKSWIALFLQQPPRWVALHYLWVMQSTFSKHSYFPFRLVGAFFLFGWVFLRFQIISYVKTHRKPTFWCHAPQQPTAQANHERANLFCPNEVTEHSVKGFGSICKIIHSSEPLKNTIIKNSKLKKAAFVQIVKSLPNCSGRREHDSPHEHSDASPLKVSPLTKIGMANRHTLSCCVSTDHVLLPKETLTSIYVKKLTF